MEWRWLACSIVEAHATSTQAGDVTELSALAAVLQEGVPAGTRIPVGGVKANIGHTLETAGVAGLVKTVLAMQHGVVPRQINVNQLNPEASVGSTATVRAAGKPCLAATCGRAPASCRRQRLWRRRPQRARRTRRIQRIIGTLGSPRSIRAARLGRQAYHFTGEQPTMRLRSSVLGPSSPGPAPWKHSGTCCNQAATRSAKSRRIDGIAQLSYDPTEKKRWHSRTTLGGFITDFEYDWKRHRIPPKQIARADPLQFMILDAVDAAFRASWLRYRAVESRSRWRGRRAPCSAVISAAISR